MTRRVVLVAGLMAIVAIPSALAWQDLTTREADSMERKLSTIVEHGALAPAGGARAVQTSFTEREVNAYFKFNPAILPTGLVNPQVTIPGASRLEARAIVDLDAVRKSKTRSLFDPANLLFGSVEVRLSGTLHAANGKGTFQLESATLGGVAVAKSLVQELVYFYSRTPDTPNGFDLDKPFDLPANIRQVQIQRGAATIIQ